MPRRSPYRIELSVEERDVLESLAHSYTLPYWRVTRAQMVLLAAEGLRNDQIAARLNCRREVSRNGASASSSSAWPASRTCRGGVGRRFFPPHVRAEVIAMACALPAEQGVPLSRWSATELAREAVARGIVEQISGVTVWRWLSQDAIKPWQHRSWIFPRDPRFAERAGRSSTSTKAAGKASCCIPATTSSAPTKSPPSKPASGSPRRSLPRPARA